MNQSMDRVLGRYNPDSSEEDEKEPMHRLQQLYILPAPGIAQPHAEPPPGLETPTPTKPLIAYMDFGADVTSSGGPFTITWDAGGIATLTVA